MKRNEAEAMIERSDMRAADRAVFLCLIRRANNHDCVIPPQFTLSLARLSTKTGYHLSTVARSLAHLELHRWIQRERSKGGRKRKDGANHRTRYLVLECGTPLACDCSKQSRDTSPKQSHEANRNSRVEVVVFAGQTPNLGEGLRDREVVGGEYVLEPVTTWPDSWSQWPAGSIGEAANRDLGRGAHDLARAA